LPWLFITISSPAWLFSQIGANTIPRHDYLSALK
jgi:hypothetical protein